MDVSISVREQRRAEGRDCAILARWSNIRDIEEAAGIELLMCRSVEARKKLTSERLECLQRGSEDQRLMSDLRSLILRFEATFTLQGICRRQLEVGHDMFQIRFFELKVVRRSI